MKITPIEIRQKSFEKEFRGYEKEEVNSFLLSMSQEWERLIDENKEYKIKLEMTEREVRKLKEVETSLYKTLKTAEDTGTHLIEQANKSAALRMLEAQQKADMLLADAQNRAKAMVSEADKRARQALGEVLAELKSLERDFRSMENLRDNMLMELKSMASDTLERVSRMDAKTAHVSFDSKIREVKNLLEQPADSAYSDLSLPKAEAKLVASLPEDVAKPVQEDRTVPLAIPPKDQAEALQMPLTANTPSPKPDVEKAPQPVAQLSQPEEKRSTGSFFDELEASSS